MVQISQRIVLACVAIAERRDRPVGLDILFILDIDVFPPVAAQPKVGAGRVGGKSVQPPATRIAGWQRAVEHLVAKLVARHYAVGVADTQRMHWKGSWYQRARVAEHVVQQLA